MVSHPGSATVADHVSGAPIGLDVYIRTAHGAVRQSSGNFPPGNSWTFTKPYSRGPLLTLVVSGALSDLQSKVPAHQRLVTVVFPRPLFSAKVEPKVELFPSRTARARY